MSCRQGNWNSNQKDYLGGSGGFDGGQSISFHGWSQFKDSSKSYKLTFWWVQFHLPKIRGWQVMCTSYMLLKSWHFQRTLLLGEIHWILNIRPALPRGHRANVLITHPLAWLIDVFWSSGKFTDECHPWQQALCPQAFLSNWLSPVEWYHCLRLVPIVS